MNELTTYSDITVAARTLNGHIFRTPLIRNKLLDNLVGAEVLIKCENLQLTGSFKFRGAFNKISRVLDNNTNKLFVAWSSGNHAQAVAAASAMGGAKATIVMPTDAPKIKIDGTKYFGAKVVFYDRNTEVREDIGRQLASETEAVIIPPYDDNEVIAGQGTVGLEAAAQMLELDVSPDVALVPCGGGGLIAGCAIALRQHFPNIVIHPVEPKGFDDTGRSLALGKRVSNTPDQGSLCDALLAPTPGALTFRINSQLLGRGKVVSDADIQFALVFAMTQLKMVAEPGGIAALADLLSNKEAYKGKKVLVILSGGNVDPSILEQAINS